MTTTDTPAPATPRAAAVLAALAHGAPQITTDPRFARHHRPGRGGDYPAVLTEPGWSPGQRALINLAAALSGHPGLPAEHLSAHLTGRQTRLALAMCHAAHTPANPARHTTGPRAA